ncbi:peroxidase 66 [Malus sylvestris]|uniref:peroxidase 66 n=1 Tax=Malus sylvestris TaxID=3752 RepID=UPI0021ACFEDB|nr:peroxidase 66 [Malus sylvestris]
MAVFAPKTMFFFFLHALLLLLSTRFSQSKAALSAQYYDQTCPQAEKIILQAVYNASMHDPKVPARILRMFFHDCFIRGCDASLLLDSTAGNQAEKDGPPNISVRSFYVIDDAKAKLEAACPHTVSCADIVGIAARDVVIMSGGPFWNLLKGRKDGRVSRANETINLPAPTFNMSQLIQSFAKRGLGVKDLVALSGGHTLGFSHCSSFESRLRNFSSVHDVDPTMNKEFAQKLRTKCSKPNRDITAGELLDSTSSTFDNNYYKQLVAGKGVFGSDQALFSDYRTRWIVESFAKDQSVFFKEFAASMVNLGNVGVIEDGGEVRLNCRVVN